MKTHKFQTGISLVELMIAMLIGLFLMGGLIQLFISSKQTYKMQDTVGRLQENQRFAMDFLVHDMRGIGGWGCFKDSSKVQSLLVSTGVFAKPINTPDGTPPSGISGENNHVSTGSTDKVLAGTDVITLYGTSALQTSTGDDVAITVAPSSPTAALSVSADSIKTTTYKDGIATGDILFIGDCEQGNIFQATGVTSGTNDTIDHAATTSPSPGNSSASLTKPFDTSARLYKFNAVTYSVYTAGDSGQPALFKSVNGGSADELIEGVENMQILYGEDKNKDSSPDYYVTANQVTNMANVVSIQVSLLMQSVDDNQTTTATPFTFPPSYLGGTSVTPTDKRIRRSVTSIISIRNRLN